MADFLTAPKRGYKLQLNTASCLPNIKSFCSVVPMKIVTQIFVGPTYKQDKFNEVPHLKSEGIST